ncbi:CAP domain-containing protein [Cohnella boryungensis]|uniref:CAP domain-containing protein n=1 Tax=Cohnella boryungensis TaxID=768479 RepID=A0ABV8S9Q3_9BACL
MKKLFLALCILLVTACGHQSLNMKTQPMPLRSSSMQTSAIETTLPANKYVAKSNESLQEIADRYHLNLDELLRANPDLQRTGGGNPNAGQPAAPGAGGNTQIPQGQEVNLPANESMTGYEQEVLRLTNAERQKAGLQPCAGDDSSLNRSARAKSQDMAVNGYFSHNSPTYGDPFAMMRSFGVQYQSAGENIAKGQPSPQEVVQAWMNSPGHRANILNGAYTHLGVGYVANNGQPCWTQQFISK